MKFFVSFVFLTTLIVGLSSPAAIMVTKKEALTDVHTFMTQLRTHYGMARYKEETYGVTIDSVEARLTKLIGKGINFEGETIVDPQGNFPIEEVQQYLIGGMALFRDGHLNAKRNSTDGWTVGLKTADIEGGRLVVVGIDENFFVGKNTTEPLEIGDEVVEVDGRPVAEIAKENLTYAQSATHDARRMWSLEKILEVPSGFLRAKKDGEQIRVKFKRDLGDGDYKYISGFFNWTHIKDFNLYRTDEETDQKWHFGNTGTTESYFHVGLKNLGLEPGAMLDIRMIVNEKIKKEVSLYKKIENNENIEEADLIDGQKMVVKSADADFLKPISRLQVYSVAHGNLKVGVIRIPNYSPPGGFGDVNAELAFLRRAIPILNKYTDMVIIDQVSNNGGYVAYVTQFVRLFAHDQELPSVTNDIRLTDTYLRLMEARAKNPSAADYVVDSAKSHPELPNFAEITISQIMHDRIAAKFKAGEKWSGDLPFMQTVESLNEGQPGIIVAGEGPTYEHKVLFLNDRRSASGGDFAAIIMKKARALLMGTTARGLGGPVYSEIDSLGLVQMFFRCTFGLCKDAQGQPFEDVGPVVDVRRDVSLRDLKNGFASWSIDVLNAAVMYYNGDTPEKISAYVNRVEAAPTFISEPTKEIDDLLKELYITAEKGTLQKVTKAYQDLKIYIEVNADQIPPEEWERLQIPVPGHLNGKDLILRSVTDRDAVVVRLKEMAQLPKFKKDRALAELIKAVTHTIDTAPAGVKVLTACNLRLVNLGRMGKKSP